MGQSSSSAKPKKRQNEENVHFNSVMDEDVGVHRRRKSKRRWENYDKKTVDAFEVWSFVEVDV